MNRRTKELAISKKVKMTVWERDKKPKTLKLKKMYLILILGVFMSI